MNKLRLDLDLLQVESFDTADREEKPRGTVHAHISLACTGDNGVTCAAGQRTCGGYTCDGDYTCNFKSCDGACGSYYCATDSSCGEPSCVNTCLVGC